jgi:hypothetical protein
VTVLGRSHGWSSSVLPVAGGGKEREARGLGRDKEAVIYSASERSAGVPKFGKVQPHNVAEYNEVHHSAMTH